YLPTEKRMKRGQDPKWGQATFLAFGGNGLSSDVPSEPEQKSSLSPFLVRCPRRGRLRDPGDIQRAGHPDEQLPAATGGGREAERRSDGRNRPPQKSGR